jgi:hypothetical protein
LAHRFVFQVERIDRRTEVLHARASMKPAIRDSVRKAVIIFVALTQSQLGD